VQADGGPELRSALLARAGRGETVLTVAAHGRTGHDAAELAVTARRDGADPDGGWLLDGVQTAVPWAFEADFLLVPARTGDDRSVLAVLTRGQEGTALAPQVSTTGERLGELRLDSARVAARDMITADGAWDRLRALLTTGTCALALGVGERVLDMTSAYAGKREQFGHPIATFQAVAVQAADRYVDLRAMEVTLWQAAWRIASGAPGALPVSGDVAVAKIWASEGVRRVVQTAQHLHGGFGADVDYPLHRYHAWAKHLELSLGPAAAHEEALGDLLAAHPLG
ncbi:acyl-CoA dehydrogenase family protein, partial [Streptomyces antibioticus]|uniref:acyl-CoA dehydrogenase family protein n=1 Tax=Streptomyces antibioticus TaxID=1890 RepID=UPI003F44E3FC